MRALKITPDFISTAEGSVLIELENAGDLHCQCERWSAGIFARARAKAGHQRIRNVAARDRRKNAREAARGKQSGRTQEIQRLIGRSIRAITDQEALESARCGWIAT